MQLSEQVGIVIIGRNEGERLVQCIKSAKRQTDKIVYVDSNSSDCSIKNAQDLGVKVIELDMSIPFSAARARNAGWKYLLNEYNTVKYIHFIDGDCTFADHWIEIAFDFMSTHQDYAIACGKRCEKFPEKSTYNALCDIEWDTPVGDALACGGDALISAQALNDVDGYKNHFIAGEEPEMCFRMRQQGWKIRRIDATMTYHDANITRFMQWWKRAKRCGYAYALGNDAHGHSPEQYKRKPTRSALIWGIVLPSALALFSMFTSLWALVFFVLYPIQVWRLNRSSNLPKNIRLIWAGSLVLAKFPESFGVVEFFYKKLFNKQSTLIEYK